MVATIAHDLDVAIEPVRVPSNTSEGEDRNQGRATCTPTPRIRLAAALPMQIRHQQMVTGSFRSVRWQSNEGPLREPA
jgi:hypothetical protein